MAALSIATAFLEKLPKFLGIDNLIGSFVGGNKNKSDPKKAIAMLFGDERHLSSITREASKSVAYYPMVVSNAVDMSSVTIINKHLERKLANLIHIIISNNDIIDLSSGQTKTDIIQALQNKTIGGKANSWSDDRLRETLQIHDIEVTDFTPTLSVAENALLSDGDSARIRTRILNESGSVMRESTQIVGSGLNNFKLSVLAEKHLKKFSEAAGDNASATGKRDNLGAMVGKIEKSNELAPTILDIEVVYQGANSGFQKTRIVIGVKVLNHLVSSSTMVEEVGTSLRDDRFAFRAIQWYTGEISFFRDLILNYSAIKKAANKNTESRYFHHMKNSATNNAKSAALGNRTMLPTTTFVLSMDEVQMIKEQYQVDLMHPNTGLSMLSLFNLLGLIIVDEPVDTMYVLSDTTGRYDELSLPKEKEDNKQSNNVVKALVAAISNK